LYGYVTPLVYLYCPFVAPFNAVGYFTPTHLEPYGCSPRGCVYDGCCGLVPARFAERLLVAGSRWLFRLLQLLPVAPCPLFSLLAQFKTFTQFTLRYTPLPITFPGGLRCVVYRYDLVRFIGFTVSFAGCLPCPDSFSSHARGCRTDVITLTRVYGCCPLCSHFGLLRYARRYPTHFDLAPVPHLHPRTCTPTRLRFV